MKWMDYIRNKDTGCCTTAELMELSKNDKEGKETLKKWTLEEMRNKGIAIDGDDAPKAE